MLIILTVLIFLFVFTLFSTLFIYINRSKINIQTRLNEIKQEREAIEIENRPFIERAILPLYNFVSEFFVRFTPTQKIKKLGKRLEEAGYSKTSLDKWVFNKTASILIVFLSTFMLFNLAIKNQLKSMVLSLLLCILDSFLFNFNLSRKITRRKRNIVRDLPYVLDLITVSVEAGLSFDGAIAKVIENIHGDLSDEFAKTLKEIRMGIQRKVALKNLSERCDVKELSMFVTSLVQADELGVSLGKVLRIESANLREQRKQRARESAMKAPIKMLFPLVFFIFPTIFIIILGPALIKMYNFFLR